MTQLPLKILMLDDSGDDIQLIELALRKSKLNFAKICADTQTQYRDAIINMKPDVVLSDHALPGFNSLEALRICRMELGDTPFILVSGAASDEFTATCLREGADDYISKSNLIPLAASIRTALKKRKLEKHRHEQLLALRRQYRELSTINRELENFVHRVSHHLRGPITTAMGLLNLAKQTYTVSELHGLFIPMYSSLTRLDDTLKCILEYSRSAHVDPKPDRIGWTALISEAFTKVDHLDHENRVTRLVHLQDDAPITSDAERLVLVLTNVLNNAFTYQRTVPLHETIVSVEVVTTVSMATITIKDNGTGISAAALPRVGELFYRGTQTGQGAGLGVYIAKEILGTIRGTLELTSTEGKGTTVVIELANLESPE